MRKILITGGAGFIGSSLAAALLKNTNNFVVVVDNLLTGTKSNLPKPNDNFRFIPCDVNNKEAISSVFHTFSFDYVFHYAAVVGVQRTLQNPIAVLDDIKGIRNILTLCKNTGVRHIYYASSSEVYGEPVELPQNEHTTPLNSRLPYAIVKNVGEAFIRSFHKEYGLNYTIFRFFNTYGIKQSRDFVISKFIAAALKDKPLTINGNGSQTRTFCLIKDNIEATINCFENNLFINDTLNIGSNTEISILDLARKIIDITKSKSSITFLPALKEGDMSRRHPDNLKMKSALGRNLTPLDDGLKIIIEKQ